MAGDEHVMKHASSIVSSKFTRSSLISGRLSHIHCLRSFHNDSTETVEYICISEFRTGKHTFKMSFIDFTNKHSESKDGSAYYCLRTTKVWVILLSAPTVIHSRPSATWAPVCASSQCLRKTTSMVAERGFDN